MARVVAWLLLFTFLAPIVLSAQELPPTNEAASQTTDTESNGESEDVPERVAVQDVDSDDSIKRRLESILETTERYRDLEVNVESSVVFLKGRASQQAHREWAGQLARNTDSVAAVVNDLTVERELNVSKTMDVVGESLSTMWHDFLERSPLLVAAVLALVVTWLLSHVARVILRRVLSRSRLRSSLQDLILQLTTIGVWLVGLMVAAVIVFPGMTPAKVLTVLGLSSVAVGFAFKDIFENFFAGILILWRYPFDKGDFIACGDIEGMIEDITIRMAMIRQVDGQLVVVPNSYLFKNPVDVLTDRSSRRITVMCGVAYDSDLSQSRDVIRKAVESCSTVKQQQPIEIFAQEFGGSSINFEVTWWTNPRPKDIRESRDEIVQAVKRALDQAEIEIPFPQRTLWFKEPLTTTSQGK